MFKRTWTGQEILALLKRYPAEGPLQLAADMNRSEDSITGMARRCCLRKKRTPYRRVSKRGHAVESEQRTVPVPLPEKQVEGAR